MGPAMDIAKLLTEIAVGLSECDYGDFTEKTMTRDHIRLHKRAQNLIFDSIRICRFENNPVYLRHYNMAALIEILPLAALYDCSSMLGIKIAYFLSQLTDLKSKPDFKFAEWLKIDMLKVYQFAPLIFDDHARPLSIY